MKKPLYSKKFIFVYLVIFLGLIIILLWIYLANRINASADINAGDAGNIILPSTKYGSIADAIAGIINWVLGFAGGLAVLALVYSGIMMITAGDNTPQVEQAKKNITWAIPGLILIASSLLIVNIVRNIF